MSTAEHTPALLSERAVTRWLRGPHHMPTIHRCHALWRRCAADLHQPDLFNDLESASADDALELMAQQAFYVGTMLVRNGRQDLWERMFLELVEADETPGAPMRWLADKSAAVRRGAF